MSRTNDLRKLIQTRLLTLSAYPLKGVFYREADEKKMYPHIVYDFDRLNLYGCEREDSTLDIDIYDTDKKRIENIADSIEDLFNYKNLPQTTILPTFFFENRRNLPDEDKNVRHILVRFTIQNYER